MEAAKVDHIKKQLIKEIVELGKPQKIKNSPLFIGIYKREGELFGAATIVPYWQSSENKTYEVKVKIKTIEFDEYAIPAAKKSTQTAIMQTLAIIFI